MKFRIGNIIKLDDNYLPPVFRKVLDIKNDLYYLSDINDYNKLSFTKNIKQGDRDYTLTKESIFKNEMEDIINE